MNSTINNSIAQTPETQAEITPQMAKDLLKNGNQRFLEKKQLSRNYEEQIAATSTGQYPFAAILSCIDSRVPTQIIFDQGIGDLFDACVAGNIVNEDILGSIEYAAKYAGVKLVVVLGHTACGAVKGACDGLKDGNLTTLLGKIQPAVDATATADGEDRSSKNASFVNNVVRKNVELTVDNIHAHSSILSGLESEGKIDIVKAIYDVKTGKVTFMD